MASFLDKVLDLFSGPNDPASGKKKLMRLVVKNLGTNKFSKFYKVKTGAIQPVFAEFFYSIYKTVSSAQIFMQNAAKSNVLKQLTINAFLDDKQLALQGGLSAESIQTRSKGMAPKELSSKLRGELEAVTSVFKGPAAGTADGCYNLILIFTSFVSFDFFGLLRKFDGSMQERNFTSPPRFGEIRGEQVIRAMQEFLEVIGCLDPDVDWKPVHRVLKSYKNMDVVVPDQWSKVLQQVRELKRSNMLELMVRHITANPMWQPKMAVPPNEHIVEPYVDSLKVSTISAIESILNAKRNAKVRELAQTVFGNDDINRLRYYTAQNNEKFIKKNFDGFTLITGLNLLKAFFADYYQKDIKEFCDLLLIRGQWYSSSLSKQLSDGFHQGRFLLDKLNAFDETLAENGPNGSRLKASLVRADRDKSQAKYIRIILNSVNEDAENMIKVAAQVFTIIERNFQAVLDDHQKTTHELIINWKELEAACPEPLIPKMTLIHQKLTAFIQILEVLSHDPEED